MQTEKFLRLKDVLNQTGLGRSTVYAMIAAGDFPRPIKIGIQAVAWAESDIQNWIMKRIENSKGRGATKNAS